MERDKERERSREDEEEDNAPASKADLARAKLKVFARYAMLAFAPVVSLAALVVAMMAASDHHSQSEGASLKEMTSRIESLNASLSETKGELDNLKFATAREKAVRAEERKKADERDTRIVQSLSHLQSKLKVSPTLEDQLREAASAQVATFATASAASAPTVAADKLPLTENSPAVSKPIATVEKPIAAAPKSKSKTPDKTPAQVKALKETIEKFNKQ